jgi:hypothetical protein
MNDTNGNHAGSLVFPLSQPSTEAHRAIFEKLGRGHATAANWMPQGLDPELDELRAEQLRIRKKAVGELAEVAALDAAHRDEDEAAAKERVDAAREGRAERPVKVTPHDDRRDQRRAIEERLDASVIVFGEIFDRATAHFQEHCDRLLAELRAELGPLEDEEREAEQRLYDIRVTKWRQYQLGDYVQKNANPELYGAQPVPEPSLPPKLFNERVAAAMLQRPVREQAVDEPARPHLQAQAEQAAIQSQVPTEEPPSLEEFAQRQVQASAPVGDPTGFVTGLNDEPLPADVDAGIEKELA